MGSKTGPKVRENRRPQGPKILASGHDRCIRRKRHRHLRRHDFQKTMFFLVSLHFSSCLGLPDRGVLEWLYGACFRTPTHKNVFWGRLYGLCFRTPTFTKHMFSCARIHPNRANALLKEKCGKITPRINADGRLLAKGEIR